MMKKVRQKLYPADRLKKENKEFKQASLKASHASHPIHGGEAA